MRNILRMLFSSLLILPISPMFVATDSFSAWYPEPTGRIQGRVFVDEDGDTSYDHGEPLLEGIEIELSSGSVTFLVLTEREGAFSVDVGYGHWQTTIRVPVGYLASNDPTRNVEIGGESTVEVFMEFALRRIAPAEGEITPQGENRDQTPNDETLVQGKTRGISDCDDNQAPSPSCTEANNSPDKQNVSAEPISDNSTDALQPIERNLAAVLILLVVIYAVLVSRLWGGHFSPKEYD